MSDVAMKALYFFGLSSLFGWIFLFTGIHARFEKRRRDESEHTRVTGRIVDYARKESLSRGRSYVHWSPVIEFEADGRHCRREYGEWMDPERHPVGEAVELLYDVSDPARFHLVSDEAYANGGRALTRIGLIWIAGAAALTLALAVFVGGLRLHG